jgi:hypothetical protein
MTVISYVVGQKYYRVDYDLKRILLYFAVAIGFYVISGSIHFSAVIIQYTLNISLFTAFLTVVYFAEKKEIQRLIKR